MKNGIDYVRRAVLELRNNGMIVLDINMESKYRLINIYRSFNPTDGSSQRDFFINQLLMIKAALERSNERIPIVVGDFNLDENKKFKNDYAYKSYYDLLDEHFDPLNLVQLVEFETWSRLVNGTWRSSGLDHMTG